MMYWRLRPALVIVLVPLLKSPSSLPQPALGIGAFFNLREAGMDNEGWPAAFVVF
jgi:hypothetical protein